MIANVIGRNAILDNSAKIKMELSLAQIYLYVVFHSPLIL